MFVDDFPDTRLIVLDVFQLVRDRPDARFETLYMTDSNDIKALREAIKGTSVSLQLVHHTRKLDDIDPLNTMSGSTGLLGALDYCWVLQRNKSGKNGRKSREAKLTIAGRDIVENCFLVNFQTHNCRWKNMGDYDEVQESRNDFVTLILSFMHDRESWTGTATELIELLKEVSPKTALTKESVTKNLNIKAKILTERGIRVEIARTKSERSITITKSGEGFVTPIPLDAGEGINNADIDALLDDTAPIADYFEHQSDDIKKFLMERLAGGIKIKSDEIISEGTQAEGFAENDLWRVATEIGVIFETAEGGSIGTWRLGTGGM
jgi:hypothetical protein